MALPFRPLNVGPQNVNRPLAQVQAESEPNPTDGPQSWAASMDFGSKTSASAFCLLSGCANSTEKLKVGEVKSVKGYTRSRSTGGYHICEVPTIVRYDENGHRWGFRAISSGTEGTGYPGQVAERFKLPLNENPKTEEECRSIEQTMPVLPCGRRMTVDEVSTDFIAQLLHHIHSALKSYKYKDGDHVHLICTVPAMWTITGKQRTIKAVENASRVSNFSISDGISLCSEPEAATAYCVQQLEQIRFKKRDAFIVCDAGGITVDVVSYVVVSVNPLRVKEIVEGNGCFSGSSYLDKNFRAQCRKRLEPVKDDLQRAKPSRSFEEVIRRLVEEFEFVIKRDYPQRHVEEIGDGDYVYARVDVTGLPERPKEGFFDGEIQIMKRHLEAVFEPVLTKIVDVVVDQIEEAYEKGHAPTRLLLVGGFGDSPRLQTYLQEKCNEWTKGHQKENIDVLPPEIPGKAISEGAIYRFQNRNMVEECISRSSICITADIPLQDYPKPHKGVKSYYDGLDKIEYVEDCVRILWRKGQPIPSDGRKEEIELYRIFEASKEIIELDLPIYVWNDGNGCDRYHIKHTKNEGYRHLETPKWTVQLRPIREKLKRVPIPHAAQSRRRFNPSRDVKSKYATKVHAAPGSSTVLNGIGSHSLSHGDCHSEVVQPAGSYYYRMDYNVVALFKGGMMKYSLKIEDVDELYEGRVNMAPYLRESLPEDE